ncbi:MAG: hypothetical protein GY835_13950 [bacterium]|nr:hypothetical protein [bacterium]
MTPGRLYLFAILCLVLASLLLLMGEDTVLINTLGAVVTVLALVSYLFGIYLNRLGRRGNEALAALRHRVETATNQKVRAEFRLYHRGGLPKVDAGEMLVLYQTGAGWLLVPILGEFTWFDIPAAGVGRVSLKQSDDSDGVSLNVELNTNDGRALALELGSTLLDPSEQTLDNVGDLIELHATLSA